MKKIFCLLLVFAMMAICPREARCELINLQFRTDLGSSYSGAAVIGSAGDTWNQFLDGFGSTELINSSNQVTITDVTVVWGGSVSTLGAETPNGFADTEYKSLMQSYLYADMQQIFFSNLMPLSTYDLYFYTEDSPDYGMSALSVTVSGKIATTATTALNDGTSDTFTQGLNYLKLNVITDESGALDISYGRGEGATNSAIINGIQLSGPTPEPSTMLLIGIGSLAGFLVCRKKTVLQ